jgi:hypothetical protein
MFAVFVFVPTREWFYTQLEGKSVQSVKETATDFANKHPGWTECRIYREPAAASARPGVLWMES